MMAILSRPQFINVTLILYCRSCNTKQLCFLLNFTAWVYFFCFIDKVTPTTCTIVNVLFQHIDHIMSIHGTQIMQAVILILEGDHPVEVKEQVSKGQLRGQGLIIGYELEIA